MHKKFSIITAYVHAALSWVRPQRTRVNVLTVYSANIEALQDSLVQDAQAKFREADHMREMSLDLATKARALEKDAQRLASTASALVAGLDSLKLDEQPQIYPDLIVGDA